MEEKKHIIIISENKEIIQKIQSRLLEWQVEDDYSVIINKTEAVEDSQENIIIIDRKDFENEFKYISSYSKSKIIVLLENFNDKPSRKILKSKISVYFIKAPINSLMYKIVNFNNGETYEEVHKVTEKNKVISIVSPSGGTGKTFLAFNIAYTLAKSSKKVLVIDLSPYSSVQTNLNIVSNNQNIDNLISEMESYKEVIYDDNFKELLINNIVTYNHNNMSFDLLYSDVPLKLEKLSSEMLENIIHASRECRYDYVFIDCHDCLSQITISSALLSSNVLIVSEATLESGFKVMQYKELLNKIRLQDKTALIINKYMKRVGLNIRQLEKELSLPIITAIKFDKAIPYYSNKELLIASKGSAVNKKLKKIEKFISSNV